MLCATIPYLSCACFASTLLLPSLRSLWQWTSLFLGWFSWQPEPHSNSNSNRVVAPFYLWINTGTARRTLEPRHFHWKFRFFCFALLILSSDGMIGCIWSLDCKSHRMRVKKKLVPFNSDHIIGIHKLRATWSMHKRYASAPFTFANCVYMCDRWLCTVVEKCLSASFGMAQLCRFFIVYLGMQFTTRTSAGSASSPPHRPRRPSTSHCGFIHSWGWIANHSYAIKACGSQSRRKANQNQIHCRSA